MYRWVDKHKKELYYIYIHHTLLTNGGHNLTIQEREMFEKTLEWLHTVEGRQPLRENTATVSIMLHASTHICTSIGQCHLCTLYTCMVVVHNHGHGL